MTIEGEGKLLRIYIGENDRWQHKPLYGEIVRAAREAHMAGATVLRGIEGFGRTSHLHSTRILRLSEDLPLVIEIVDSVERIDGFLQTIDPMIHGGMITTEQVSVHVYRGREHPE